jgi:hypothetical protein
MAQKVNIVLVDDLDGSEATESVSFGLDGTSYEIDLNDKNAAQLRDALAPYVGHARKVGSASRRNGRRSCRGGQRRARAPARSATGPAPTATRSRTAAASPPRSAPPSTRPTDGPRALPGFSPGLPGTCSL